MADAAQRRERLTRERVLEAATALADRDGIAALTLRSLAAELGVKPMSVYHHVAGKEAILDGIVDRVFAEVVVPTDAGWRAAMAERARSMRAALARHPWAVTLMDSRSSPGPATLRHHEAALGVLRRQGFSVAMAAHAFALLDAFIYGFAVQEASLPFEGPADLAAIAEPILSAAAAQELPYFVELATEHALLPGYDFGDEFDFGLELILDGLERRLGDA